MDAVVSTPSLRIALIGVPNCGKTALFNRLTGSRQKVANYPGVTVERREGERTAADGLSGLLAELEGYGAPDPAAPPPPPADQDLVVPLQLSTPYGDLALLYAATVFGSPRDVTLDEIAIETFFPADAFSPRNAL